MSALFVHINYGQHHLHLSACQYHYTCPCPYHATKGKEIVISGEAIGASRTLFTLPQVCAPWHEVFPPSNYGSPSILSGTGWWKLKGNPQPKAAPNTQLAKVSAVSLLVLLITTSYSCYAVRVPEASAGCGLTTGNKRLKLFFPALSWQPGAQQAMQQPCPCGTTTHHPPMCQHLHSPGGSWPSQNVLNTSSGISSSVLLSLKPLSTWS